MKGSPNHATFSKKPETLGGLPGGIYAGSSTYGGPRGKRSARLRGAGNGLAFFMGNEVPQGFEWLAEQAPEVLNLAEAEAEADVVVDAPSMVCKPGDAQMQALSDGLLRLDRYERAHPEITFDAHGNVQGSRRQHRAAPNMQMNNRLPLSNVLHGNKFAVGNTFNRKTIDIMRAYKGRDKFYAHLRGLEKENAGHPRSSQEAKWLKKATAGEAMFGLIFEEMQQRANAQLKQQQNISGGEFIVNMGQPIGAVLTFAKGESGAEISARGFVAEAETTTMYSPVHGAEIEVAFAQGEDYGALRNKCQTSHMLVKWGRLQGRQQGSGTYGITLLCPVAEQNPVIKQPGEKFEDAFGCVVTPSVLEHANATMQTMLMPQPGKQTKPLQPGQAEAFMAGMLHNQQVLSRRTPFLAASIGEIAAAQGAPLDDVITIEYYKGGFNSNFAA